MNKQKNFVGLKELRANMDQYIERVQNGESVTVLRRSRPVFILSPVSETEDGWENIIDFTEIHPEGVSGRDVMAAIKKMHG